MYFIGSFIMLLLLSIFFGFMFRYKDEMLARDVIEEEDFDTPLIWILFLSIFWPITIAAIIILGVIIFISEYKLD